MGNQQLESRLAVCSWSLQPASPHELVTRLAETGVRRIQLALDPLRGNPPVWGQAHELLASRGVSIVSGMFGCVGEDYSTLDTIKATGGIAPDATWGQNLQNIRQTVGLAKKLGLQLVTFHAGFLPHEPADPNYRKMLDRLAQVAGLFAAEQIGLGLETGQETAPVLRQLLETLKQPNLGVNFDPANMILYDKGDPIEALKVLGPWIRQVHIKDATRTKVPGTWGEEVPAGTGQVDCHAFFTSLKDLGFRGNVVIEREAGTQRVADIRTARLMAERYFV